MAVRQDASTGELVDDGTPAAKPKDPKHPTIHVKVHSPFKVYFDDDAFSVSAENDTGPFDILPRHHSFITLLNPCEIAIHAANERQDKYRIRIDRGVMHVKADAVIVFLDV
jgi:F0F1-type ATP synthase epsilon subunit